jgi:hypothetical protein
MLAVFLNVVTVGYPLRGVIAAVQYGTFLRTDAMLRYAAARFTVLLAYTVAVSSLVYIS